MESAAPVLSLETLRQSARNFMLIEQLLILIREANKKCMALILFYISCFHICGKQIYTRRYSQRCEI